MTIKNKTKPIGTAVPPGRKISSKLALMISTGMMVSGCASLQAPDDALANRLMQKLDERDKLIDNLQQRVQQLESSNTARPSNNQQAAAAATPPDKNAAVSAANQAAAQKKPATAQPGKPGAGSFDVDEDAAQRALERTLVQTGALLLPFGQAEIQPFATYTRRENKQPFLFLNNNAGLQVANASLRRNQFDMGANLLVGLPFETQAELRIPYQVVNQSVVTTDGTKSIENNTNADSLANVRVGLAKTLTHEGTWMPDLTARVAWDAPTGKMTDNNIALNTGFTDFVASLTALKRQDPLAFTGTVAYQKTLKKNGIEPGDQISLNVGATLAASPQTSLSIGLQQIYSRETKINNVKVPGSDNVSSAFTLGASSTIGRSLFVSLLGGIGLTESAPSYFFNVTIPFRFDVPFKLGGGKP
ncbi:MAG: hypothetical protein ACXWF8_03835 [Methylobacter sp.]